MSNLQNAFFINPVFVPDCIAANTEENIKRLMFLMEICVFLWIKETVSNVFIITIKRFE